MNDMREQNTPPNPKRLDPNNRAPKGHNKADITKKRTINDNTAMKKGTRTSNAQDQIAILTLGNVCLLIVCALAELPILTSVLIVLTFTTLTFIYIRKTRPKEAQTPQKTKNKTAQDYANIGEARLADGFDEAVLIINAQNRIEHANPVAVDILNVKNKFTPVMTSIRNPDILKRIDSALNGKTSEPYIYHIETPVHKYFKVVASPINVEDTSPAKRRALIILYDITDIIRANEMRSDFLANASHELKTPIASLLGYIETLQGHAKEDKAAQVKFLKIMQMQAERMQRLIDDLLSLRRIEQAEHIAPTDIVDLSLATESAIASLMPLAERRAVQIKFEKLNPNTTHEFGFPVIGVHDQLVQLTLNLIANALHISSSGSEINIILDRVKDWDAALEIKRKSFGKASIKRKICPIETLNQPLFRLRIRDKGRGFERAHIPRLGERFYRVSGDRENKERGTGLGLAIVKHITLGHRGGLFVESAHNIGTEFTVLLPTSPQKPTQAQT